MPLMASASAHLLVIDVQERLAPALTAASSLLARVKLLLAAAREFGLPVTVTEQYPAGLGRTVADVVATLPPDAAVIEKTAFSAFAAIEGRLAMLAASGRTELIVCGAEAHVCVLQTVIDARDRGVSVILAADAVSSRRWIDEDIALRRMAEAGAKLATTEMIVFEWLREAGTPSFKALAPAIKALGNC
ncbi:isochorismatase hydrolase [Methylocella silvestris BL2]|uniref:Isochorismatase hydrolase n=1 Tax=Methylocella silvestris (strain DSM 15510 / CIP 108128 / LMG 27833 / NCIMB 13906 / BL2) TaxID=395965 RepID=B8ESW5_METSB|nr:isochorismatase family protein [Methylocella silvestris]ACK50450.1 isochorismatase hydrolase [Methylocella silvestris BL2]